MPGATREKLAGPDKETLCPPSNGARRRNGRRRFVRSLPPAEQRARFYGPVTRPAQLRPRRGNFSIAEVRLMTGSDFRGFIPDGNLCWAHARASLRRPRELRCLSITIIANAATVRGALDSTPSGREGNRRSSWTLLITLQREPSSCFLGNIRSSSLRNHGPHP